MVSQKRFLTAFFVWLLLGQVSDILTAQAYEDEMIPSPYVQGDTDGMSSRKGLRQGPRSNPSLAPDFLDPSVKESESRQDKRQQLLMEKVGLSQPQVSQIEAIEKTIRDQTKLMNQSLKEKQQALLQYLGSVDAKEDKALLMQREVFALQRELNEARIKTLFKVRRVMTAEQFQKFKELSQSRGAVLVRPHPSGPRSNKPSLKSREPLNFYASPVPESGADGESTDPALKVL